MNNFQKGDLVAKVYQTNTEEIRLQMGIIIKSTKACFTINWLSYNKTFFMEKEGDMFNHLNNSHLLGCEAYKHEAINPFLTLLNSNYKHGKRRRQTRKKTKNDYSSI